MGTLHPCQVWGLRRRAYQRPRAGSEPPESPKGSPSSMWKTWCRLYDRINVNSRSVCSWLEYIYFLGTLRLTTKQDSRNIDRSINCNAYPPCSVDTNSILSPGCISYASSPSSSQSASLIRTRIPGRLEMYASAILFFLCASKTKLTHARQEQIALSFCPSFRVPQDNESAMQYSVASLHCFSLESTVEVCERWQKVSRGRLLKGRRNRVRLCIKEKL